MSSASPSSSSSSSSSSTSSSQLVTSSSQIDDGNKRKRSESIENINDNSLNAKGSPGVRARINVNKEIKLDGKITTSLGKNKERWRMHRMSEDYVNLVGDLMYPKTLFGPYGYNIEEGRFSVDRITTLGYLLNPLRRPTTIEKWSPIEIAIFEASLTLNGKKFNLVSKHVS
jgi:hypothetical protein